MNSDAFLIEDDVVYLADNAGAAARQLVSDKPNIIKAWKVVIAGNVAAPGQDVTIVASQVEFKNGGEINTSGIDGHPNFPAGLPHTFVPIKDGAKGTKGDDGGDASNAGNVTIICDQIIGTVIKVSAKGGVGGQGQDGADGHPGADASPAPPIIIHNNGQIPNPIPIGSQGGQGGQGGTPGTPGKSGNGGNLKLFVTQKLRPDFQITSDLSGGAPLLSANPGNPGSGGNGGAGPPVIIANFVRSLSGGHIVNSIVAQGAHGSVGPTGLPADKVTAPAAGNSGKLEVIEINSSDVAKQCSMSQLQRILAAAETEYQNDKATDALPRLLWVSTIGALMPQN